jgi:hypothetical protein
MLGFLLWVLADRRAAIAFSCFLGEDDVDDGLNDDGAEATAPSELCRESVGTLGSLVFSLLLCFGVGGDGKKEKATRLNSDAQGALLFSSISFTAQIIFWLSFSILEFWSRLRPWNSSPKPANTRMSSRLAQNAKHNPRSSSS